MKKAGVPRAGGILLPRRPPKNKPNRCFEKALKNKGKNLVAQISRMLDEPDWRNKIASSKSRSSTCTAFCTKHGCKDGKTPTNLKFFIFKRKSNLFFLFFMVSGWWLSPTPVKNMSSSVGMVIPNIWKNKKCSEPPTRFVWKKQLVVTMALAWLPACEKKWPASAPSALPGPDARRASSSMIHGKS